MPVLSILRGTVAVKASGSRGAEYWLMLSSSRFELPKGVLPQLQRIVSREARQIAVMLHIAKPKAG